MKTFDISLGRVMTSLLARKKLTVEYGDFDTAYYAPAEQKVKLPINWVSLSRDVFNLLSGHEVSHALHSPSRFFDDAKKYGTSLLMILEDARIENLIKDEFPGIISSFKNGYNALLEKDFFGIDHLRGDYSRLSFIDRINLKAKCGESLSMPFTDDEKEFFDRVMGTREYDGIIDLAEEYIRRFKENDDDNNDSDYNGLNPDDYGTSEDSGVQSFMPNDDDGTDGEPTDDGDESDESESTDDDGDAEPTDDSNGVNGGADSHDHGDTVDNELPPLEEGVTERSQREKLSSMTNDNIHADDIFDIPEWDDVKNRVLGFEDGCERRHKSKTPMSLASNSLRKNCKIKRKEIQRNANLMAMEFKRRKSAMARVDTKKAETGNLDMGRLVHYKYSDDIFKSKKILPQGKNHGFIIFVDHSSSMFYSMESVYTQLLTFATFCKIINVPYKIYSFTNYYPIYDVLNGGKIIPGTFLSNVRYNLEVFSSKMTDRQFNQMFEYFIPFAVSYKKAMNAMLIDCNNNGGIIYDRLYGTPLLETVVDSFAITDQFIRENPKVEKIKTIYITDGAGRDCAIPSTIRHKNRIYQNDSANHDDDNNDEKDLYLAYNDKYANSVRFLAETYEKAFGIDIMNIKIIDEDDPFISRIYGQKCKKSFDDNGIFTASPRNVVYMGNAVSVQDQLWSFQYNVKNVLSNKGSRKQAINNGLVDDKNDAFQDVEDQFMNDGKSRKMETNIFKTLASQLFS